MTKIAMLGVGRMGREIIKRAVEEGLDVVAAIDSPENPIIGKDAGVVSGTDALGVKISSAAELESTLKETKPQVVVDFTNAEACFWNFKLICRRGINVVVGTTGFSDEQLSEMKREAIKCNIGVVISPNMSVGVNIFWDLVRRATKNLMDYDVEIIEQHHRFKKDSPSGTALRTAEIIAEEMERNLKDIAVYGRKGSRERERGEIGIHAIRAGDIVGEHTVIYATLGERIEITHKAHSRTAFVNGVIKAIEFIKDKKGIYGMNDVLDI
ncbi:MAG TPA: 4-hydroxy-tetrahydrodipicolinate reductase [Candidatus Altiarchaeales archaeon]|nr:4-hydroxy-tetrahydrodipicolinate reductase [Candidatus Altiarchaeales archaeon]